jgi:hypothetical protein
MEKQIRLSNPKILFVILVILTLLGYKILSNGSFFRGDSNHTYHIENKDSKIIENLLGNTDFGSSWNIVQIDTYQSGQTRDDNALQIIIGTYNEYQFSLYEYIYIYSSNLSFSEIQNVFINDRVNESQVDYHEITNDILINTLSNSNSEIEFCCFQDVSLNEKKCLLFIKQQQYFYTIDLSFYGNISNENVSMAIEEIFQNFD